MREIHGTRLPDPYAWLRNLNGDPRVRQYLESENAFTHEVMADTTDLQRTLYDEMIARVVQTDVSVPVRRDSWWYYTRTHEGSQYRVHCRVQGDVEPDVKAGVSFAGEQVVLDENVIAADSDYLRVGALSVSPDQRYVAYSIDTSGDEFYTLRIQDLEAGELLPESIERTYYSVAWANDSRTLFYNVLNDASRPFRVLRHEIGTNPVNDAVIANEEDESWYVDISHSRDRRFLFLNIGSLTTSEVHVLPADQPLGQFQLIEAREHLHDYSVEHDHGRFLIRTNSGGATNFRVMEAPTDSPHRESWRELVAARDDVKLEGVEVFDRHVVLVERSAGLVQLAVHETDKLGNDAGKYVRFPEPAYEISPGSNPMTDTDTYRFGYTSMVSPPATYDLDFRTNELTLKKRTDVPGYDPDDYVAERVHATAPDGVKVPMSLVYRRDLPRDGSSPALLYGYGSYGIVVEPNFSTTRLSLIDRGLVYAIAHIRGGSDLGEQWWNDGKLHNKRNTFTDFVAAAEHLIGSGYTSTGNIAIHGGSAGGLLMGAVTNLRPDLFGAVIADVPFVDVMNTILDPNLPLSVLEYDEWGNPNEPDDYAYMRSYSPYDNVRAVDYPNILAMGGLNDPRVSYWEPAKWVARLRAMRTNGDRMLLLKTNMSAGHGGSSGRYDYLKEVAFRYAFVLKSLGVRQQG